MNREEFLRGLENALSGNVPPSVVRDNLRYYDDYIRSERQKGRSESDIMDELGDPRLIARTILIQRRERQRVSMRSIIRSAVLPETAAEPVSRRSRSRPSMAITAEPEISTTTT